MEPVRLPNSSRRWGGDLLPLLSDQMIGKRRKETGGGKERVHRMSSNHRRDPGHKLLEVGGTEGRMLVMGSFNHDVRVRGKYLSKEPPKRK